VAYTVVFDNGGTIVNLNNIVDGHTIMVSPQIATTYSILDVSDPSIPCTPTFQNSSVTINVSNISLTTSVQSDYDGFGVSCNNNTDGSALAVAENGAAPYTYNWENGSTGATVENLGAGLYTVTATDAVGCTSEAQVTLTSPAPIQFEGTATAPTCFGYDDGTIVLDVITGGSGDYAYALDGQNFTTINSIPLTIPFVTSGLQTITIQDANGCTEEYNSTVPTPFLNYIDLGGDQEIILGETYTIPTVANFDIDTFFWSTTEWMDCGDCLQPLLSPYYTTTYEIQAVDENGCTAINEVTISVKKPRAVYIPNAFSPNGDGDNEKFTVYAGGEVVQVNYLRIFSRWGELLFENDNFGPNDERLGWDGYFKGDVVQSGVYVYVTEVLFVDGEVLLYKGDLTVLR
jgi:gliding motility-associated-like protein